MRTTIKGNLELVTTAEMGSTLDLGADEEAILLRDEEQALLRDGIKQKSV